MVVVPVETAPVLVPPANAAPVVVAPVTVVPVVLVPVTVPPVEVDPPHPTVKVQGGHKVLPQLFPLRLKSLEKHHVLGSPTCCRHAELQLLLVHTFEVEQG